ncbi:hypothetical protein [Pararhodobacter sp. CCB-MM2]|uniref:hypothetical protein n=1 Tax=Pararhodobacter sp. CCB-MM2 TaxID=1786003 RepID=UPI000835071D|nr:hypothetical protein [Pararhodobacter sp. CCB-MM2]
MSEQTLPVFAENIRLVIWDLDETFWNGTLEEGQVSIPAAHIEIVKELAARGIVSSICSKNDFSRVQERLDAEDLWKWFVFPTVAYANKSGMISAVLEQMGLRAPTVLFIDDNPFNRGEVRDLVEGINVADEAIIGGLLSHPQMQGKPDPDLSRLSRYGVLQEKQEAISAAEVPEDFLRSCDIKVSFHFDIDENFERIHDLVNRTNQLNFTKKRWDEDINLARAAYHDQVRREHTRHAGYVKVRDRFGFYGICGFYEIAGPRVLNHFLFSCRALNMGVEQFVYQNIGFPGLKVVGPVAGTIQPKALVDWITIVDDAEIDTESETEPKVQVCLHGPCELAQSSHYLRPYFNIEEEFQFPKQGWGILPLVRNTILADELSQAGLSSLAELGLSEDFAGIDVSALGSTFFDNKSDVLVWSFSQEFIAGLYRSIETNLCIPLSIDGFNQEDFTSFPFETISTQRAVKESHYRQVSGHFEKVDAASVAEIFEKDLASLAEKIVLASRPVIIVEPFDNVEMIDRPIYRAKVELNKKVRAALSACPNVSFVPFSACVADGSKEVSANHFQRSCYLELAQLLRAEISRVLAQRRVDSAEAERSTPLGRLAKRILGGARGGGR